MRTAVALLGLLLLGCGAPATEPLTLGGAPTAVTSAGEAEALAARCAYLASVATELADSRNGDARQVRRQLRTLAAGLQASEAPAGLESFRVDLVRELRELAALAGEADAALDAEVEQARLAGGALDEGQASTLGTLRAWGPFHAAAGALDRQLEEHRSAHGCG